MFFTTHDNLNMYYELRGNENSSKKLVFLNGLTQSTIAWEFCIMPLLAEYHIVLVDLLFQGKSDKAKHHRNFDEHAQDVFGLVSTLFKQPVSIAGISYGSLVAQHFATKYPYQLEKLILISTFAHKTALYKNIELSWKNALNIGGNELMLDVMLPFVLGSSYFDNPFIPIDALKNMRKDLQPDADSVLKLMQATEERPDYLQELKTVSAPTLIIQGSNDMLFPVYFAEAVHEAIPNSKLEVVEKCGHTINLEAPQILASLIANFIQ